MTVYVVSHKEYDFPKSDDYNVIQVGKRFNADYLCDSAGENISLKNKNYCELTALYWLWKNSNDEFVGLVHYRRYFGSIEQIISIKNNYIATESELKKSAIRGIVVPKKQKLDMSVYKHWAHCHYLKDWLGIGRLIRTNYSEYLDAYYEVSEADELYLYNMFYMNKNVMNDYCAWLFELLSEYEEFIDLSQYSVYQARFFGFASERLFNIWLRKNKYKICELDVVALEDTSLIEVGEHNMIASLKLKFIKYLKELNSFFKYRAFKIGLI